jgi:hypothetical protein
MIRLIVILCVGFVAGYVYNDSQDREACENMDGLWQNGICKVIEG